MIHELQHSYANNRRPHHYDYNAAALCVHLNERIISESSNLIDAGEVKTTVTVEHLVFHFIQMSELNCSLAFASRANFSELGELYSENFFFIILQ